MDKGIEALINKPIHQERRFQFIGKKQIEYWAEIDAGAYKYLPESERRIVYSELEVKALIAALGQAQRYSKKRDEENQDLMLTIGRLRVEREQLEASPNGMMQLSNELAEMKRKCAELEASNNPMKFSESYDADECRDFAWEHVKGLLGTDGWTVGDSCNYFGFYCWGWDMRRQYNEQRAAGGTVEGSE